jgi:pyroglutamyl-peptidase
MPERTLVTGFGPFLDVTDNPSAQLAEKLGLPYHVLEVSYEAVEEFLANLDASSFDRLLMLGVAKGRAHLCAELFARNTYGSVLDTSGNARSGAIDESQPLLLESTLFGAESLAQVLSTHPNLRTSLDAGAYLCNFTYFKALARFPSKRVGFLHVPDFEKISFEEQLEVIRAVLAGVNG